MEPTSGSGDLAVRIALARMNSDSVTPLDLADWASASRYLALPLERPLYTPRVHARLDSSLTDPSDDELREAGSELPGSGR